MMDDYLDHLISSSPWVDEDVKERSSWSSNESSRLNVLLPTSLRLYEDDTRNSPISMISSSQHVECLAAQDTTSFVLDSEPDYTVHERFVGAEDQLQKEDKNYNGNSSPIGLMNGSLKAENIGLQYGGTLSTPISMTFCYPKQLPVAGDLIPPLSSTEAFNFECNGSGQSEYLKSFKSLQNLSSMQQLWPSLSYDGRSSLPPLMGLDRMEGFGLQEGQLNGGSDVAAKRSMDVDKFHRVDKELVLNPKLNEDFQNHSLSSFTAEPNVTMVTNQLPSLPQTTSCGLTGHCSGNGKARVRARRGQATDPHSIAERLRREKIAERMRNLQELVPNANKVDKASMLDEIIEYVKFLQLQVKVLSMSRLGAAGAVIPLITDGQTEGSNSLSLLPTASSGIETASSPDQVAFEQEVLKLMESNMTMAMHYLQSKGLCLMPIALAAAISGGKGSLSGAASNERKKLVFTNGLGHDNSSGSSSGSCGLLGIETHQVSYDRNDLRNGSNCVENNGCNGAITREELKMA